MRILVLTYEFPPVGGGGGKVAQDICRQLAARGHSVTVITAHFDRLPRGEDQDGVRVVRLPSGRKEAFRAGIGAMGGYVWAAFWGGLGWIRRERPEILHVHFAVPSGVPAWLLHKITGVPYVLTAHLGDVPGGVPEKTGRWFRWIYPLTPPIWKDAARVTAVSHFTRRLARQAYPVDPVMIPNGVDLAVLDPGEILSHKPPRLVFAGRFMPQKNPVGLIRILRKIKDLEWDCLMIGDGPLRTEVEAEIERCQLGDRVRLTGWLKPEEVSAWMRTGDILFMPSKSEGLPVVGVQAMALGLALVVSRAGGFPELVEEGVNGHLADAGDDETFEKALRRLLTEPEILLEQRRASRQMAQAFNLTSVAAQYEKIFQSVIDASRGSRS